MTDSIGRSAAAKPGCSSRIPLIPVRYAAIPKSPADPVYAYAKADYKLKSDFPELKEAAYTLRALRPGYIYVWMDGPEGEKLSIHEHDGEGGYRALRYLGLENYHQRNAYQTDRPASTVWADACATEVWIGYSSHLWTNAITEKVSAQVAFRKRLMHKLDLKDLINGEKTPSKQEHILPVDALPLWVEDFKPDNVRQPLDWSASYHPVHTQTSLLQAIATEYPHTRPRVPAVVALFDAEGLTMDLGLMVAAQQHQIMDLNNPALHKTGNKNGKNGGGENGDSSTPIVIPPAFKLDAEQLHAASAEFQHKQLIAVLIDQVFEELFKSSGKSDDLVKDSNDLARRRREWHQAQPRGHHVPSQQELRVDVLTDEKNSPATARFAKRIDMDAYGQFLTQRDEAEKQIQKLKEQAERAAADHDAWLATAELAHIDTPCSVAASCSAYDCDHAISSRGLEQNSALFMHGMGLPLPGRHNEDPRFTRLGKWIDEENSPLYMALAAYSPFRQKADAVGNLFAASSDILEELGGKFPAINGATDLIVQNVSTVIMRRVGKKTRWSASKGFREQVEAAVSVGNLDKVTGVMGARYVITEQKIEANQFSKEVQAFIDSGMAEVKETSSVEGPKGSRKRVTIEGTKTQRVVPNIAALTKIGGVAALDAGMVLFNVIYLYDKLLELDDKYTHETALNFASAISGLIGALGSSFVTARSAYVMVMARASAVAQLPGVAATAAATKFLSSRFFARVTGWPGIVWGLWIDGAKAMRLNGTGGAVGYTFSSGITLALGSSILVESALVSSLIGTATGGAFVPAVGWVLTVGCLLVAGGVWLAALADGENHTPLEDWVTRGIFGNRMGEDTEGRARAADDRPIAYADLPSEIKGWYEARYAPLLLDANQAEALGWRGADSQWHENFGYTDSAEFTVLLPGYIEGHSNWTGGLSNITPARNANELPTLNVYDTKPMEKIIPQGLMLRFGKFVAESDTISLGITYQPNQGLDVTAKVTATFKLSDGWFD